jgi:hypothetical protein
LLFGACGGLFSFIEGHGAIQESWPNRKRTRQEKIMKNSTISIISFALAAAAGVLVLFLALDMISSLTDYVLAVMPK